MTGCEIIYLPEVTLGTPAGGDVPLFDQFTWQHRASFPDGTTCRKMSDRTYPLRYEDLNLNFYQLRCHDTVGMVNVRFVHDA